MSLDMGQRISSRSRARIHPALNVPETRHIFTKPSREYLSDGRTLIRVPPPVGGPPGSHTLIFADGSYIIGIISNKTYYSTGYCEYRDIANRLIYTGYMHESMYNGWGSIWDETGSWPEYTTYWSQSRPGNRVLHTTPTEMKWDLTFEEGKIAHETKIIKPLSPAVRTVFDTIRSSFARHTQGSTEPHFQDIIQLYTDLRGCMEHTPPSPNIGPIANSVFKKRVNELTFHPLTPPTPPKRSASTSPKGTVISNPLRIRIPPINYDHEE